MFVGLLLAGAASADSPSRPLGIGAPAAPAAIAGWDIDIRADGQGLPPGRGSVAEGAAIYGRQCAACHGADGRQGALTAALRLAGGQGSLATLQPQMTVGSFWPYATTLFDYVRRAMPFDAPQSLTPAEVYAVSAYILHLGGILPAEASLDAGNLAGVRMPNRDGFRPPER